ncbi:MULTISPECIES: asparagine synthase (glutamine-hydrolyzing) [unclassified Polaribacter]|uniref:asparagine synthase (glutamine-hydrolyzing) n=1 Tax=unclassified Polaribacter TaxID=196858 RepID=UPI0011BF0D80|nr:MULTISPECIES: asparagine synthase (glutamine-hydrolyzing) [unclassified Polaribacter]TXD54287.1 asparagine synthase (glutamine-hydrolyzing) [Polaribacter sp. IC063]TXD62882.1 asparagine synthase (glutamine-hydrolyzing) [Polaribacter sp. IC066]
MCGIAGIINFNQELEKATSLKKMTDSLRHRGPDDEGYMLYSNTSSVFFGNDSLVKKTNHINTANNHHFKVGFGFRQLKIIDLTEKSHQPLTDISRKFWIIFNGELYNYKEIRHELEGLGHQFLSNSDTEVVLNSYKQWGKKALEKFNGMFAFAILDTHKNKVFIARDRIGIKPVYFHKNNAHFIFASTVQSIIKSTLYKPTINWEGLWQNFRFTTAQRPNTVFEDIFALEPAHHVTIYLNNNFVKKEKYWEIPTQTQDFSLSEKQSKNLIEESLYKAVNYRLIADVEVGSFMSGGIDSSLISVIASKRKPNIKILTLGFENLKKFNEVAYAQETAQLHHLNHIIKYADVKESFKNLKQSVIAYEEPYHSISANFILSEMAAKNKTTVVLSGLGGDELFGGYDVFKKISLWEQLRSHKKLIHLIPEIHQKIKKAKKIANCSNFGEYYSHYHTNFYDEEIENLFLNKSFNTTSTLENLYTSKNTAFTDTFEAMSFFHLKSYISNHQMRALDATTMAFSIEGRFPLLDHNFIEDSFKIPTKFKIKNNTQKYILKEIAKNHLSKNVLQMPKKGLAVPLKNWIENDLKDFVLETIKQLKNRNIFNNVAVHKILKSKNEAKIWQLVSTEIWLQNFIDKP